MLFTREPFCLVCHRTTVPVPRTNLAGLALAYRYQCQSCGCKRSQLTGLGELFVASVAILSALTSVALPDFKSDDDRIWLVPISIAAAIGAALWLNSNRKVAFPLSFGPEPDADSASRSSWRKTLWIGTTVLVLGTITATVVRENMNQRRIEHLAARYEETLQRVQQQVVRFAGRISGAPAADAALDCSNIPESADRVPLVHSTFLESLRTGTDYRHRPDIPHWINSRAFNFVSRNSTPSRNQRSLEEAIVSLEALARAQYIAIVWTSPVAAPQLASEHTFTGGSVQGTLALFDQAGNAHCVCTFSSTPTVAITVKQSSAEQDEWATRKALSDAAADEFWDQARNALGRVNKTARLDRDL
jgi:hypothetical protein